MFIDNCTATQNKKSGIAVNSFYGMVYLTNTASSENEGHGIVFSSKSYLRQMLTSESNESDVNYLDGYPSEVNQRNSPRHRGTLRSPVGARALEQPSFIPMGGDSLGE